MYQTQAGLILPGINKKWFVNTNHLIYLEIAVFNFRQYIVPYAQ